MCCPSCGNKNVAPDAAGCCRCNACGYTDVADEFDETLNALTEMVRFDPTTQTDVPSA